MTITDGSSIFIDTNILVYANSLESPFHHVAVQSLKQIDANFETIWISRQVLREFISVLSKEVSFPIEMIVERVRYFERILSVAEENEMVTRELLTILISEKTKGKHIHDANIVATMLAYSIPNLLTKNKKDFERFSSAITVLTMEEVLL